MSEFLLGYLPVLILFGIALVLSLLFLLVPAVIAPKDPDSEKISTYECGFNAFDDSRMKFDVQFYLVAIMFIIFDVELVFLIPFAVSLGEISAYGWVVVMIFMAELIWGYLYALKIGALDWD